MELINENIEMGMPTGTTRRQNRLRQFGMRQEQQHFAAAGLEFQCNVGYRDRIREVIGNRVRWVAMSDDSANIPAG